MIKMAYQHLNQNGPKPSQIVIAQVTKISQFGAYCKLIEYENTEIFIPIREVSSGWIKNIHEFLHIGQKVVCKITYIDNQKGTIDASIKKVMSKEAKDKLGNYNLEKRLSVLLQKMIKSSGEEKQKEKILQIITSEFGSYPMMYQNAVENSDAFKESKIPNKIKVLLLEFIKENNEKKTHRVSYVLNMVVENTQSGISQINQAMVAAEKFGASISYISSPKYHITAEGLDYSESEEKIKKAVEVIKSMLKNTDIVMEKEKLKREQDGVFDSN